MSNQVEKSSETFSRLPTNVIPNHYFIEIIPDLPTFTFAGSETVNVDVRQKTSSIVLNALHLQIQSASFASNGQEQQSTSIELNKDAETATISFANELNVGPGQLKLQFTGEINDNMKGCYRSKYTTPEGELRYALCTQFESVYCRMAFPCWDEPALKAKFDLTLVAPKDRVALSNMPVVEEKDYEADNSKKVLKFGTSPIMSTYLLCYVIGEYEYIEKITKNNTIVRMYTETGKTDQGKFALEVAVRSLEFYEDFFKIPFPLPKVDLIAISEFNAGAMENWGLITYRQTCVLYDPENSSAQRKQIVAIVIAHELAHQWFGNLVTMEWWTHLWLNEGFASFMENFCTDILYPEFSIWPQFIGDTHSVALSSDALHNSHPIEVPVKHPREIEEIFDNISYNKGASVIRMLYYYIGNDNFQKGLSLYLNKFAYKNTYTEDLWDCLEEASKKPVRAIMSSWTRQMGYPIITVTSRQDSSNRVLSLTQEKFSVDGVLSEKDQQAKWLIPLDIISQNNQKPVKVLLENRTQEVVLENVEPNEWVLLNSEMTSFCRINYPPELIEQLQKSILDKSLSSANRMSIQEDVFALVQSGKISTDRILKLWESYIDETDYTVWGPIIASLSTLNKLLEYTDYQEVYHLYVRKILSKILPIVGIQSVPNEDHQTSLLRSSVFALLCAVKDPQVLQEAKSMFESHIAKISLISPNLRLSVYKSIVGECDDKTYESLFQLYRETELQEEKNRIAFSLGSTKCVSRIQRVIDFAMSDEVKKQDAVQVLTSISRANKVGREIVWDYFKANHARFVEKYDGGHMLSYLVSGVSENFASLEKLQEASEFFATHSIRCCERTQQQSLESIKLNAEWLSRDSAAIKNYLTNSS